MKTIPIIPLDVKAAIKDFKKYEKTKGKYVVLEVVYKNGIVRQLNKKETYPSLERAWQKVTQYMKAEDFARTVEEGWCSPPECYAHIEYRDYIVKAPDGSWITMEQYGPGDDQWEWGRWKKPPKVGDAY